MPPVHESGMPVPSVAAVPFHGEMPVAYTLCGTCAMRTMRTVAGHDTLAGLELLSKVKRLAVLAKYGGEL